MDWRRVTALTVSDKMAGLSAVLSLIALIVSVRGCVISEKAVNEAHVQFSQDRQLILTASFSEEADVPCDEWSVKPIAEGFQYQQGRMFLPPAISREPVYIDSSGRVRLLRGACAALQKYAATTMAPKRPNTMAVGERDIPIIIKSFYAVKGEAYEDEAIYVLHGAIGVPYADSSAVDISFDGLSFLQRRPPHQVVDAGVLDKLMTNGRSPLAE